MPNETGFSAVRASTETPVLSRIGTRLRISGNLWLILGFSAFYFADVCIRASQKYFWYDELFTVYLSRLPAFQSLWDALRHGADFNPPLLYLLTKASWAIFGSGLIGTRVPEIIGFWVMCLCLFQFVNRRAGVLAGSIAMMLPLVTGAFYYSYEARPYGIILGFCGLALVCWQKALDTRRRGWWLTGLSFSLFAAFMLHCYALVVVIPFAMTEVIRTFRSKRADWAMWVALLAPAFVAIPVYVPLLHVYSSQANGTGYARMFAPDWFQVTKFYLFLLTPWLLITLVAVVLLAVDRIRNLPGESGRGTWSGQIVSEIALVLFLIALPVFGVVLGKLVHGPFFARYFLSATVGICALTGLAFGAQNPRNWLAAMLVAVVVGTLGLQFTRLLWHVHNGWGEPLIEPSTGITLDTTPGYPLDIHPLLASEVHASLPIGVPLSVDFLYLTHYSPALAPRLYLIGGSERDFSLVGFRRVHQFLSVKYDHLLTTQEFLHLFPDSLIYADKISIGSLAELVGRGVTIESLKDDGSHFLAEIRTKPSQSAASADSSKAPRE